MLGLATRGWKSVIAPDYTRPAPIVCLDIMKAFFETGTDFCLLCFAGLAWVVHNRFSATY